MASEVNEGKDYDAETCRRQVWFYAKKLVVSQYSGGDLEKAKADVQHWVDKLLEAVSPR